MRRGGWHVRTVAKLSHSADKTAFHIKGSLVAVEGDEAVTTHEFAEGLEEILVVEEKRQILEYALKEELYNWRDDVRPKVYGKFDAKGSAGGEWSVPRSEWLLPAAKELSAAIVAKAIAKRLGALELPEAIRCLISL